MTRDDQKGRNMNGKGQGLSEDLLALIIGLVIFVLALGVLGGVDLLGWVITTSVWTDLSKALAPISENYLRKLVRDCGVPLDPMVEGVRRLVAAWREYRASFIFLMPM